MTAILLLLVALQLEPAASPITIVGPERVGPRSIIYAYVGGRWLLADRVVIIGVEAGSPEPPRPEPEPSPTPPAGPTGPLRAVAVFELSKLASLPASQRDLRTDRAMYDALRQMDVTWQSYDASAPPVSTASWQAILKQTGLPALVILDDTGKVYSKVPLPHDAAGVVVAARLVRSPR